MRCWAARAVASAALALARAAVAGAVKPARWLSCVRRAVAARDWASRSATSSCCRAGAQAAHLQRHLGGHAHAGLVPQGLGTGEALGGGGVARGLAGAEQVDLPPARNPAWAVVAGVVGGVTPRLALARASSVGSRAARAVVCVAWASSTRLRVWGEARADALGGFGSAPPAQGRGCAPPVGGAAATACRAAAGPPAGGVAGATCAGGRVVVQAVRAAAGGQPSQVGAVGRGGAREGAVTQGHLRLGSGGGGFRQQSGGGQSRSACG